MNDKDDLKKELKKKQHNFDEAKEHANKTLKREKTKIYKEEEQKLTEEEKKLSKELTTLHKKRSKALNKIESRFKKVTKLFDKKAKEAVTEKEKEHKKIHREAEHANHIVEEMTAKEIESARKELISVRKRVYSRRRKIINFLQLVLVLYLFILSVIVIKEVALALSEGAIEAISTTVDNDVSAFGAGWFTTVIAQSGSVIAILANSLVGAKIITFEVGFFILLGITLGNPLTPVIASLVIKTKDHWHLQRGFELGLATIVYSFYLIVLVVLIEIPTGLFTKSGEAVAGWAEGFPVFQEIPDLLSVITAPLLELIRFDLWPIPIGFVFGIGLLIFSLGKVGKSVFVFLGGKRHARAIMEKMLGNHWKAFGIGLGLTIIIPSASLLTTLMVPLAIAQLVRLRQAIPYLIGTSVATFIDVLLASFANSQPYAIAGGVVLTMIAGLGILFIPGNFGTNLVYKTTKYLSTHVIKMRRRNILKYIAAFMVIPIILILIF
ncbi:hypothetical protein ACFL3T_01230 [Patescibacteria group bacterium]